MEKKQKVMDEMRLSHKIMQDKSGARKSIRMNDVVMNLDELDLKKLTKE
jgi:cytochrome c553